MLAFPIVSHPPLNLSYANNADIAIITRNKYDVREEDEIETAANPTSSCSFQSAFLSAVSLNMARKIENPKGSNTN